MYSGSITRNEKYTKSMLSESKFYMDYSRWDDELGRYETWEESVERVINMHRKKYNHVMNDQLKQAIDFVEEAYKKKAILGAQRALQFGGEQIFKNEVRLYNCAFSYTDRPEFFQHAMYLLLSGCGVGFSVQKHHIDKLPKLEKVDTSDFKIFTIPDSIEGWSDAFGVLLSSYLTEDAPFPEYKGKSVIFDPSEIRPKGAYISGGFKAPGPAGLMRSLEMCRELLNNVTNVSDEPIKLTPIQAYDFVMHMADAVLSGGVRRAATICIFSKDDKEMLNAKTGNWFNTNPQRGRSNNSALLVRDDLTREEWADIMDSVKEFGEPGFIFADDTEMGYNPCVEIGLRAYTEDGVSGFQFCNLSEISGAYCTDKEKLMYAAKAAAIIGTLQAGYTNYTYLDEATKKITERESLLGVSITGWMTNPSVLFDEVNMKEAAELVVKTNKEIASLIGINPAARSTTVKPSGNASVLLGCASGIHGEHAPRYFRNVQMNKESEVYKLLNETNPMMVEESVWSQNNTDVVISFPIVADMDSIYKKDLLGVKQLEYVKKAQQTWIKYGKDESLCVDPGLSHNVSNTITVDDWDEVEEYIYQNRHYFAGISLMPATGDKAYAQAPFTEVFTAEQIIESYGIPATLASDLITDGRHAFNGDLWLACDTVLGKGVAPKEECSERLLMKDWARRAKRFADSYFDGEVERMTFYLKDVHNLHKWESIMNNLVPVSFSTDLEQKVYTEVDTIAGAACSGGACEVEF